MGGDWEYDSKSDSHFVVIFLVALGRNTLPPPHKTLDFLPRDNQNTTTTAAMSNFVHTHHHHPDSPEERDPPPLTLAATEDSSDSESLGMLFDILGTDIDVGPYLSVGDAVTSSCVDQDPFPLSHGDGDWDQESLGMLQHCLIVDASNPREADVMLGRGQGTYKHCGHKKFLALARRLAKQEGYRYLKKEDKGLVVTKLIQGVQNAGGRFLIKDDEHSSQWRQLPYYDKKVWDKCSQMLRDRARELEG